MAFKTKELIKDGDFVGMMNCFYCNKPKAIALDRRMKKSLPREAVYDKEPCDDCKKYMEQGIIFISVKPAIQEERENPYRTGGWWVIKEEAVKKFLSGEMLKDVLRKRVCFVEDEVCEKIGLKKENLKNE